MWEGRRGGRRNRGLGEENEKKKKKRQTCLALSTLVPSSRTMSGISSLMDLQALTMPLAMVAQLTMPPNTLTRIAFTPLSSVMMRNACFTWARCHRTGEGGEGGGEKMGGIQVGL